MTSERSKRRDFFALVFISKSISKKLLIVNIVGIKALRFFFIHPSYIYLHVVDCLGILVVLVHKKLTRKAPILTSKGFFQSWLNCKPVTLLLQVCSHW